jgi:hypothetical protein
MTMIGVAVRRSGIVVVKKREGKISGKQKRN